MLTFDTVSETFRLMSRPPGGDARQSGHYKTTRRRTVGSWPLQDYEAENWVLRHRVQGVQPPPRLDWDPRMIIKALSVGSSTILIGFPYETRLYFIPSKREEGAQRNQF
ncbi:hypothetical protein BAE44_0024810 [Dichanthelium oligosanthes]|uniref:Uncharacterized protein n=1 Tax=Dichanthelium oligosanthes TaxID=888268 RepID=A0A1E5UMS8_9POAL|nr:hypothetical protein BAE44_0024810 [Dichanthelium oligosanthes]